VKTLTFRGRVCLCVYDYSMCRQCYKVTSCFS